MPDNFASRWFVNTFGIDGGVPQSTIKVKDGATIVVPPPWLTRITELLGLYEIPGDGDNETIIAMARACGGKIARTYKHDSIPWCALAMNYCLMNKGLKGNDSLWALDFRNYGKKLIRPAVGAIGTIKRPGGGHVFFVVGKTKDGKIVGRGGNQNDMICDSVFATEGMRFNWPTNGGVPNYDLPIIKTAIRSQRPITLAVLQGDTSNTAVAFGNLPEVDPHAPTGFALITSRLVGYVTAGSTAVVSFFASFSDNPNKVTETIEVVKDQTGTVKSVGVDVVKKAPDGLWEQIVSITTSPVFLTIVLIIIIISWFMSYVLTRRT